MVYGLRSSFTDKAGGLQRGWVSHKTAQSTKAYTEPVPNDSGASVFSTLPCFARMLTSRWTHDWLSAHKTQKRQIVPMHCMEYNKTWAWICLFSSWWEYSIKWPHSVINAYDHCPNDEAKKNISSTFTSLVNIYVSGIWPYLRQALANTLFGNITWGQKKTLVNKVERAMKLVRTPRF